MAFDATILLFWLAWIIIPTLAGVAMVWMKVRKLERALERSRRQLAAQSLRSQQTDLI